MRSFWYVGQNDRAVGRTNILRFEMLELWPRLQRGVTFLQPFQKLRIWLLSDGGFAAEKNVYMH